MRAAALFGLSPQRPSGLWLLSLVAFAVTLQNAAAALEDEHCEKLITRRLRALKKGTFQNPHVNKSRVKFDSEKYRLELDRLRSAINDTKPETKDRSQAELAWSEYFNKQPYFLTAAQERLAEFKVDFDEVILFG